MCSRGINLFTFLFASHIILEDKYCSFCLSRKENIKPLFCLCGVVTSSLYYKHLSSLYSLQWFSEAFHFKLFVLKVLHISAPSVPHLPFQPFILSLFYSKTIAFGRLFCEQFPPHHIRFSTAVKKRTVQLQALNSSSNNKTTCIFRSLFGDPLDGCHVVL